MCQTSLSKMCVQWMLLCMLVLSTTTLIRAGKWIPSFAGPYVAYTKEWEHCEPGSSADVTWNLRHTHFNPAKPLAPQIYEGNLTLAHDLDDSLSCHLQFDIRSNNQWKPNALIFNFPAKACSATRQNFPSLMYAWFGNETMTKPGPCIVPKGHYEYKNKPIPLVFPRFPVLPYGLYRTTVRLGRSDARSSSMCYIVIMHFIPRPE